MLGSATQPHGQGAMKGSGLAEYKVEVLNVAGPRQSSD